MHNKCIALLKRVFLHNFLCINPFSMHKHLGNYFCFIQSKYNIINFELFAIHHFKEQTSTFLFLKRPWECRGSNRLMSQSCWRILLRIKVHYVQFLFWNFLTCFPVQLLLFHIKHKWTIGCNNQVLVLFKHETLALRVIKEKHTW